MLCFCMYKYLYICVCGAEFLPRLVIGGFTHTKECKMLTDYMACIYINDLEVFRRTHQHQDLEMKINLKLDMHKHVNMTVQTFGTETYSLADSVGTK